MLSINDIVSEGLGLTLIINLNHMRKPFGETSHEMHKKHLGGIERCWAANVCRVRVKVRVTIKPALTHALHFLRQDGQIHADGEDMTSPVRCVFVCACTYRHEGRQHMCTSRASRSAQHLIRL